MTVQLQSHRQRHRPQQIQHLHRIERKNNTHTHWSITVPQKHCSNHLITSKYKDDCVVRQKHVSSIIDWLIDNRRDVLVIFCNLCKKITLLNLFFCRLWKYIKQTRTPLSYNTLWQLKQHDIYFRFYNANETFVQHFLSCFCEIRKNFQNNQQ